MALLGTLLLGSILTRIWAETSPERQIERENDTPQGTYLIQGNTYGVLVSPMSYYQTELWEVAQIYNYDYDTLFDLWKCEDSRLKHDNIWGLAGEYGAFQFMPKTFKSYADYYGLDEANWFSFKDQAKLTTLMLKDNLGYHWTCWKKLLILSP